jgi:hypothetical protein
MNAEFDYNNMKFRYDKEHLDDIFMTMVDMYPSVQDPNLSGQINLWELFQMIKYNFADDVELFPIQNPKYLDGERNPVFDEHKETLPTVCYNANFSSYKDLSNLISPTKLMFLDIDDFDSTDEALAYKNHVIENYDWIIACNLSLSRIGLHIIILVDKINDNDDYNQKYNFISTAYFDGMLDPISKSLTRHTVVPFDYNIYINESPKVLDIDDIINSKEKGIRSVYNVGEKNEKGISSAHKKEEEIYTPYPFSFNSPLHQIMNDAARKHSLRFRQEIDESFFSDPDIPIYVPEGIDVIEVNLFPLRDRKLREGKGTSCLRASFIGALTIKMIYLNNESFEHINHSVRRDILKFILHINKTVCDPPLSHKQVLNSYNANWKKYKAGDLDIGKYFKKQKAFWSKNTTLKGNEKRKVTCRIKNEPIVNESKRRIKEAIETIYTLREKVTQKKVAIVSELKLSTVKKYRDYYNEIAKEHKLSNQGVCVVPLTIAIEPEFEDCIDVSEIIDIQDTSEEINDINTSGLEPEQRMYVENAGIIKFDENEPHSLENVEKILSDEQLHKVYDRVFSCFKKRIDDNAEKVLFTRFTHRFNQLPKDDARLLILPIENIVDGDTYWKQSTLESNFWNLCEDLIR